MRRQALSKIKPMRGTYSSNFSSIVDNIVGDISFINRFCGGFNGVSFRGGRLLVGPAPRTPAWQKIKERWKQREAKMAEIQKRLFEEGRLE